VLEEQDREYEARKHQIAAEVAWYQRRARKLQEEQERRRQEEADRIKAKRQAMIDQVVATVEPVLAQYLSRRAPATTLKELLFGHKRKGIRGLVEDCPRDPADEAYAHWAERLLPLVLATGWKTTPEALRVQLSRHYSGNKKTLTVQKPYSVYGLLSTAKRQ
jgi:hypothetical protein